MVLKKICILADFPTGALEGDMAGRGGGHAATWLPQLAKAWENQKAFEIHWCVLDARMSNTVSKQCWNQYFHKLPCPSVTTSMLLLRWPQRLIYRKIFQQISPDLVHCWGTETLHGAALFEFKAPSILSMQGVITTCFKTGDLQGWRWKLFRRWEPTSMRKASLITCESQWGMDQVNSIVPGKRMNRVEYGVFPSFYQVSWQPDSRVPRILFVGGLNRLKGIDLLISMLRDYPSLPWKLVFAGAGYLAEELRTLNHPSVELLGTLKTNQVQEEMSKAWALVHPSRADTSPNVVKEARVIGLPVIGSPNGGHAEYIEHGKDGFIVDSDNPDDWFAALNQLGTDYNLCRQMGALNHQSYREYFRPEKTAEEFLNLYREMLS
jgi:glycosyltransferase involved in cell wall biosynthesis